MNFNWSTNAALFHVRVTANNSLSREEVMGATSTVLYAKGLKFWGDWQWYVWEVGENWTVAHPELWGNWSHLAKTLSHKSDRAPGHGPSLAPAKTPVMWSGPATQSHSPPTSPPFPGNSVFPTWDIRARSVLNLGDFLWRMETSNHFWAHCWAGLQTHAARARPVLLPLVNHNVCCAHCWPLLWGRTTSGLEQSHHWFCLAVQWRMTSAVWKVGLMSHLFLQRSC